MPFRAKFFLTIAAFCIAPLVVVCVVGFLNEQRAIEQLAGAGLRDSLITTAHRSQELFHRCDEQLMLTANRQSLRDYLQPGKPKPPIDQQNGPVSVGDLRIDVLPPLWLVGDELMDFVEAAAFNTSLVMIDLQKQSLLIADRTSNPKGKISLRSGSEAYGYYIKEVDGRVWSAKDDVPLCSIVFDPQFGDVRRCSVPIFLTEDRAAAPPGGALISYSRLDLLFASAAQERLAQLREGNGQGNSLTVVLDGSGKIIYHPNDTLRHQPIGTSEPGWSAIASSMTSGGRGVSRFKSTTGEDWQAAYQPLALGLSLAQARNLTLVQQPARVHLLWSLGLSLLLGLSVALALSVSYQRQQRSLNRITKRAAAIAGGELDEKLDLLSRDDLRPLADSVNLMNDRLREQLAREAEAHQFQSFIKLSALLTHDLKNAIGALSLTVSNMERHFDKPAFRADALKNLAGAADKLRALVARLSNPVDTLSGEFKRPRPTDLIPLLRQGLARYAEPVDSEIAVEARLPPSLFALVDAERLERVIENLIINAVEAMSQNGGKLVVSAGKLEGGKVFFSVTDTGPGMSADFIKDRLFRPFATTKQRGVGLGLYTCREVVRASGGSINAESKEGSGTTFRVVLASAG